MKRRMFLKAASTSTVAGMAALAGCSSGNDGSGNGSEGTGASGEDTSGGDTETSGGDTGDAGTTQGPGEGTSTSGGATTGTNGTSGTTSGGGGGTTTVGMHTDGSEYYNDPIGLYVEPGTTVTFEIESGAHSATSYTEDNPSVSERRIPEGAESWDSGTISSGESFDYTFEAEGTYDYYCIPHKTLGMVGRVVVGSPGGPAEGSMPPDGDVPESSAIVEQGSISYSDFS